MDRDASTSLLPVEDYEAIESAVMETERGRWFLAEYARRNRHADTTTIVETLERLEKTVRRERAVPDIDRIKLDLADMAEAISRTKMEISQIQHESDKGGRFAEASSELDSIVTQTESATNEILLSAEKIQELAWTLREHKAPDEICDQLDAAATDIYTGCSFQDLTGQRTRKVITVLRYLESRISTMIGIWSLGETDLDGLMDPSMLAGMATAPEFGKPDPNDTRPDAHLLHGPARPGDGINQGDIDSLLGGAPDETTAAGSVEAATDDETIDIETMTFDRIDVAPEPAEVSFADDVVGDNPVALAEDVALADDLDMVDGDPAAAIADTAPMATAADVFAPSAEPEADAAIDLAAADVFAPAAPAAELAPVVMRQRVGNTLVEVEVAAEAAPALVVVPQKDPIADMTVGQRLVTFG